MKAQPTLLGLPQELRDQLYIHLREELHFRDVDTLLRDELYPDEELQLKNVAEPLRDTFLELPMDAIFPERPSQNLVLVNHQLQAGYTTRWPKNIKKCILKVGHTFDELARKEPGCPNSNASNRCSASRKNTVLTLLSRIEIIDILIGKYLAHMFRVVKSIPIQIPKLMESICYRVSCMRIALGSIDFGHSGHTFERIHLVSFGELERMPDAMGIFRLRQRERGMLVTDGYTFFTAVTAYDKMHSDRDGEGYGKEVVTPKECRLWTAEDANRVFGD